MLPQRITFPAVRLRRANSFPHTLFRTLCRSQQTQLLCNQANPNSCSKTPGVGCPEHNCGASGAGQPLDRSWVCVSTFRMNTCKSVSIQTALTTFRMNTYVKQGGGGGTRRALAHNKKEGANFAPSLTAQNVQSAYRQDSRSCLAVTTKSARQPWSTHIPRRLVPQLYPLVQRASLCWAAKRTSPPWVSTEQECFLMSSELHANLCARLFSPYWSVRFSSR